MDNIILQEREMREDFANVYNKWIQQVPAFVILPILQNLTNSARQAVEIQYQQALEKESEVNSNVEETNNRGTSNN